MFFKRVLPVIAFSILLSACGLVDTEAAGEAIALKEQVLRIQSEELDPLLDQLSDFQSSIEPLEKEIDDLEDQRDGLVEQGRVLADEFEREMRDRFESVYQDDEGTRRIFEEQIEALHDELQDQENDLEDQYRAIEDQHDELNDQNDDIQDQYGDIEDQYGAIEDQFNDFEKERRDVERGFEDKWTDVETQSKTLWDDSEKEMQAKRMEFESGQNASTPEMDALEEQFAQLRAAETSLQKLSSDIRLQEMAIEERRFELEDLLLPLRDQQDDLHRQQNAVWESESSVDYNFLREAAYDEIRTLQDTLESTWNAEQDASEVDWVEREARRRAAEDQHSAVLAAINSERTAAYALADQSEVIAAAEQNISSLSGNYADSRQKYQNLLEEVNSKIQGIGGGAAAGQESSGELRAKLESARIEYQDANDLVGQLDSIIIGSEEPNPEFATAIQARDDAALTLQSAQDTLAGTPAETEGPADPDNPTADPVMIVHPDYLTAQAAVADAQLVFDAAQAAVAATPETLITENKPNPAYEAAKIQVVNLQRTVKQLEQQQSNSQQDSEQVDVVNPDLTAAYALKTEYESILKDLENQYALDSKTLADKVSVGAESVNVSNVESDLEAKIVEADRILKLSLEQIDSEQLGTGEKSGTISELERQIKQLEVQARSLEKEQQLSHRTREAKANEIRAAIRSLQDDKIDPLQDAQKENDRANRPLRKQQMVIERERMILQDQRPLLDEQREPLQAARQEMQNVARQELEAWQRNLMEGVETQANQLHEVVQKEMKEAQREIEDKMWALDDQRGDLQDQQGDLEDQRRDLDDQRSGLEDQVRALEDQRRDIEDQHEEVENQRDDLEDAFFEERDARIAEIQGMQDSLREEKMLPLEIEAQELDDQIAVKWESLDVLYADQDGLKDQIEALQIVVRDLDRQAEFGVLNVISGALEAAEEMEKSGGSQAAFESLLPDIGIGE